MFWFIVDGVLCSRLLQPSSRCTTPALSAAALASLGGSSSRRGSGDAGSIVMDAEASISELRVIMLFICIAQTNTNCWCISWNKMNLPALNIFGLSIEHHTFLLNASDLRESTCVHFTVLSVSVNAFVSFLFMFESFGKLSPFCVCMNVQSEVTALTFSECQTFPWFIPPSQQDIYDLKDQIQDVEGRYMQGLKELKVEVLSSKHAFPHSPLTHQALSTPCLKAWALHESFTY